MQSRKPSCAAPARAARTSSSTGGSSMSADQQRQRAYPAIEIRLATVDDIDDLVLLFATFFRESHYQPVLQFDPAVAAKYLRVAIGSGFSPHIVAVHDKKIVGVISYHIDSSF